MVRLLLPALCSLLTPLAAATLEQDFRSPPAAAKPYVWWHWMGANISKEGITKDLEAMKAAGIGGATIFNITSGVRESHAPIADLPWPDRTYRSPAYWDCLRHAATEAKRLGLELGLHNTVGYSTTGGPWISEAQAMKHVLWSETAVTGGQTVTVDLPVPKPRLNGGWGGLHRDPPTFSRDIAVIALPAGDGPVAPDRLLDLSALVNAQGSLTWANPPAGAWTVVRLGYGPTGATPHPVPDELIGRVREADKIDPTVTDAHWAAVLDPLREHLGSLVGDSFRHVLIDSYEAEHQNWTDGLRDDFRSRFGYDPAPWLVAQVPMLGAKGKPTRIVGSEDLSARFNHDLQTLVAERFQRDGWERAQAHLRPLGLTLQHEAYSGPFDTVAGSFTADVPMGEFWTTSGGGIGGSIVPAARAGGRRVIAAEAFTGLPKNSAFTETPAFLLRDTLGAFAGGVNRLVLHHWVHQPFEDRYVPGQGMGWWGTHFSRHQTWAAGGAAWLTFAGRAQVLLQHGETPVPVLGIGRPVGDSDAVPVGAFLAQARVEDGDVVLASGRRYAVLALPGHPAQRPEVLAKLVELHAAGATLVVGPPPERSPSLRGYPGCDDEVRRLAGLLWAPGTPRVFRAVPEALAERRVVAPVQILAGKVRTLVRSAADADVVWVTNLETQDQPTTLSLAGDNRLPEVWDPATGTTAPAPVWRRVDGRTEVDLVVPAEAALAVVRRAPASVPAVEQVLITQGSGQVIGTTQGPRLRAEVPITATVRRGGTTVQVQAAPVAGPQVVTGPWTVTFAGPGTPGTSTTLPELASWTTHPNPGVRYASGTGTYARDIEVPAQWLTDPARVVVDLGEVRDVAQVRVNGTEVATLWRPPYRVDITAALRPGANALAIAVANTWHNRLVGDEQEPEDCTWGPVTSMGGAVVGRGLAAFPAWFREGTPRPSPGRKCFVTWNYVTKDTPLQPAGLIGPVRLVPVIEVPLQP